MKYERMPIEVESPEELGYSRVKYNLAESSVADRKLGDLAINLNDVLLAYNEHRGLSSLREIIASESKNLQADNVLVTAGAAMALFLVSTSLLSDKDHLVVIRPNYATNIETPRAIACQMSIIDLYFEEKFEINIEQIRSAMKSNTKLISITNPHNPTGKLFSHETMLQLIHLAEENNCFLLVDETYRDLNFQTPLPEYYAEISDKVITVSSLSKAFGVPGIRIGWLIAKNKELMHTLLAAKEQIILGNSIVDEQIALHILQHKKELLKPVHEHIRKNFSLLKQWFDKQTFLEWVEPTAGVVCFPKIKTDFEFDFPSFQKELLETYHTMIGYGHWFEQSQTYFRLGFGYPSTEEFEKGLHAFEACLNKYCKKVK